MSITINKMLSKFKLKGSNKRNISHRKLLAQLKPSGFLVLVTIFVNILRRCVFGIMKFLENPILHPIIFSIYPILFIYAHNITELFPKVLLLPISASILSTLFLLVIFYLFQKDIYKSGILTSATLILFFNFLAISVFLMEHFKLFNSRADIFLLYIAIIAVLMFILWKTKINTKVFTSFLNVTSVFLLISILSIIVPYEINIRNKINIENKSIQNNEDNVLIGGRDIYYIVLDSYGRQDILKEDYDFDNTEFINYLQSKGFYIASESHSNYAFTHLSLPSTFNFEYLDYINKIYGTDRLKIDPFLNKLFQENKAAQFLKSKGYQFINFDSGWWFTQNVPIADVNVRKGAVSSFLGKNYSIDDFTVCLLNTTALAPFIKEKLVDSARGRILYNFSKLSELPYKRQNKFVFAHFLVPHPPYLFDENGNNVPDKSPSGFSKELDIKQLQYVNKLAKITIDRILSRSDKKPIIILASDHGPLIPGLDGYNNPPRDLAKRRMSNLNAYYFPDGGDALLYNSITPVNSFRVMFNYYFGTSYKLLEDKSYFSWANDLYRFYDVTNEINYKE